MKLENDLSLNFLYEKNKQYIFSSYISINLHNDEPFSYQITGTTYFVWIPWRGSWRVSSFLRFLASSNHCKFWVYYSLSVCSFFLKVAWVFKFVFKFSLDFVFDITLNCCRVYFELKYNILKCDINFSLTEIILNQ